MEIDTNQRTNLAFWLATVNPALFGGVILTGVSAAHSEIVLNFFKNSNLSLNKIFSSFSTSDLNGGIDPLESLHKGVLVYRQGILSRSGWFLCPSSNEMPQALQVTLADQMDSGKLAPLILLDDGHKQDETNNTKLKDWNREYSTSLYDSLRSTVSSRKK